MRLIQEQEIDPITQSGPWSSLLRLIAWLWRCTVGPLWRRTFRPFEYDHDAIDAGGHVPQHGAEGTDTTMRMTVECAPSRSYYARRFSVERALRAVEPLAPEGARIAESSETEGVRAQRDSQLGPHDYVWICPSGKIALSVPVSIGVDASGVRTLDFAAVLAPVAEVYNLAHTQEFIETFGRRKAPRSLDWRIFTSSYSRLIDHQVVPSWQALRFPRTEAQRGQQDRYPQCPSGGYGTMKLRGNRLRPTTLRSTLRIFGCAFLSTNGYHDYENAVFEATEIVSQRI